MLYNEKRKNLLHDFGLILLTTIIVFAVLFAYVQAVLSVPNNVIIQTSTMEVASTSSNTESLADTIARIKDTVVEINTTYDSGTGAGSGVIIAHDSSNTYSYIITNHHVIEDSNSIEVVLTDGTTYTATLVGSDPIGDIAIIKIPTVNTTVAELGDSSQLQVGDTAIVIGNPLGVLGGTVTNGIVSALDRQIDVEGNTMTLLQTNAQINAGNSGGGLFNEQGLLMGIVNAKSFGTGIEGIGFAIPINTAKDIATQLIDTSTSTSFGFVTGRVALGINYLEINEDNFMDYANGYSRIGVWVESFQENSDAEGAGILLNDKIVSINGTDVLTIQEINDILKTHNIGDTLILVISRNNVQMLFQVSLTQYIYSL